MNSDYPRLSKLQSPRELCGMKISELEKVAAEVRKAIVQEVSQTGGHFSSNLGTVELTVALYAAYDLEVDKVIWDTGHQAYPHKLLTGRLEGFRTLRKHGGLSGFLKRSESPYDAFGAGHAGTAISAALGFALARDHRQGPEKIACVTGDASIASGMSWEALNHAGALETPFCVVLNDNRMSIAPNVGALKNSLARLRSRPLLQSLARQAKGIVHRMPEPITKVAEGLRHGITHYLAPEPTGTIFEEMGFEYIGPVDGHDLRTLVSIFRNIRELPGPVLVHAITVKGKGYEVSEADSRKWHAVVPFDTSEPELPKSAGPITFTQAFGSVAIECAEADENVVAITAAMPDGTGLNGFAAKFPERLYDVGIAEQHAVTLAAGMAANGLKPFCAIYSTFLQRAYDQVVHDVALQKLPVRFFLDRAGLVGDDGPTHHGAFDLSYLLHIPNMVVLAPRDTTELKEMARWAMNYNDGPCAIRYSRGAGQDDLPEMRSPIQFGRAEVLRQGDRVSLIAIGSMVGVAMDAAKLLAAEGIEAEVINARFAKPLDVESILASAEKTRRVITIEENSRPGGFGEMVRDALADYDIPVRIAALPDRFVDHGTQKLLKEEVGLSAEAIADRAKSWVLGGSHDPLSTGGRS